MYKLGRGWFQIPAWFACCLPVEDASSASVFKQVHSPMVCAMQSVAVQSVLRFHPVLEYLPLATSSYELSAMITVMCTVPLFPSS